MKKIYLDYAASTPVDEEVFHAMLPYFSEHYGNPSSVHSFGRDAQIAVDASRAKVAALLSCLSQEVIFTGSATEANNLAIIGAAREALKKKDNIHIISSRIEHESVRESLYYLEKEHGVRVTYLPVTSGGFVRPEDVAAALGEDTVLVSVMYANNEIGTVQPIKEISDSIKNWKLEIGNWKLGAGYPLLHTDAVQAANYCSLNVAELGIDMMTLSGHKMYGPKGAGALYIKKGTPIAPIALGGGQEYGKRSGTENVPAIVGFARALEKAAAHRESASEKARALRDYFIAQIALRVPQALLNGAREPRLPNNAHILFPGMSAADCIVALDMEGIAVSAGSACQSKALAESHVLSAIGLSKEDAKSSVRFSLGKYTTKEDLDDALSVLVKLVNRFQS